MKKLIEQMLKFGLVGFVCFFIDYLIGIIVLNIILHTAGEQFFELASMAGSALGFTISVIVNYILSFKFVFGYEFLKIIFELSFEYKHVPKKYLF